MKKYVYKKGYSLIETLVYLSLFLFVIGSGVVSAFYLIDSIKKVEIRGDMFEEGHFIVQKIYWAVSQAEDVRVSENSSEQHNELTIDTYNSKSLRVYLKEGRIVMEDGGKDFDISNPQYTVGLMQFEINKEKTLLSVRFNLDNNPFSVLFILLP